MSDAVETTSSVPAPVRPRPAVVPGLLLLASAALLGLSSVLPMAWLDDGASGQAAVWMTRTSRDAGPDTLLVVLVWVTVALLAAAGAALALATATWVRVVVRCLAVAPVLVQCLAVAWWWRAWSVVVPDGAPGAVLGPGFYGALASLVLTLVGVLVPGRSGPLTVAPAVPVNPAAMGSSPPGWYDVGGQQHYWDGSEWTTAAAPT